jgi:hypothetical protein
VAPAGLQPWTPALLTHAHKGRCLGAQQEQEGQQGEGQREEEGEQEGGQQQEGQQQDITSAQTQRDKEVCPLKVASIVLLVVQYHATSPLLESVCYVPLHAFSCHVRCARSVTCEPLCAAPLCAVLCCAMLRCTRQFVTTHLHSRLTPAQCVLTCRPGHLQTAGPAGQTRQQEEGEAGGHLSRSLHSCTAAHLQWCPETSQVCLQAQLSQQGNQNTNSRGPRQPGMSVTWAMRYRLSRLATRLVCCILALPHITVRSHACAAVGP